VGLGASGAAVAAVRRCNSRVVHTSREDSRWAGLVRTVHFLISQIFLKLTPIDSIKRLPLLAQNFPNKI
jgi:hypothetical protein